MKMFHKLKLKECAYHKFRSLKR